MIGQQKIKNELGFYVLSVLSDQCSLCVGNVLFMCRPCAQSYDNAQRTDFISTWIHP
jgi:hypothetical protein